VDDPGTSFPGLTHREVQANGLRFHVAECGEGDRLALCLHGFPELWISWRYQMPLLARRGWRVWAPDLRGYGGSERPPGREDYAVETLMADVAGLIDAAGAREVMLLAHDWGGIVAWYFAMRKFRRLDRLVVMNLPHPGAARAAFRGLRQLRSSWYAFFFQLPWLPERLLAAGGARAVGEAFLSMAQHPERFPDDLLQRYRDAALEPGALTAMLSYYRALLRGGGLRRQRAQGFPVIETPTLMLWGEHDRALTRETTLGTDAYVKELTLRYLPDASHWVQQDDPENVGAMLEAWLDGRPVPEARPA
jgi:pimeloyl-ACP methyl ester carboxylesterase